MTAPRIEEDYRGFRLIAALWKGECRGRIYFRDRPIFEIRGDGLEAVMALLRAEADAERTQAWRADALHVEYETELGDFLVVRRRFLEAYGLPADDLQTAHIAAGRSAPLICLTCRDDVDNELIGEYDAELADRQRAWDDYEEGMDVASLQGERLAEHWHKKHEFLNVPAPVGTIRIFAGIELVCVRCQVRLCSVCARCACDGRDDEGLPMSFEDAVRRAAARPGSLLRRDPEHEGWWLVLYDS